MYETLAEPVLSLVVLNAFFLPHSSCHCLLGQLIIIIVSTAQDSVPIPVRPLRRLMFPLPFSIAVNVSQHNYSFRKSKTPKIRSNEDIIILHNYCNNLISAKSKGRLANTLKYNAIATVRNGTEERLLIVS